MPRTPILPRIAAILDAAPVREGWLPQGFTHRALAMLVYETDEPSTAQLSAVRRAVAKLVAAGRAERNLDRAGRCGWHLGADTHWRTQRRPLTDAEVGAMLDGGEDPRRHLYANPPGVEIRRPMTDAERETRNALREARAAEQIIERNL